MWRMRRAKSLSVSTRGSTSAKPFHRATRIEGIILQPLVVSDLFAKGLCLSQRKHSTCVGRVSRYSIPWTCASPSTPRAEGYPTATKQLAPWRGTAASDTSPVADRKPVSSPANSTQRYRGSSRNSRAPERTRRAHAQGTPGALVARLERLQGCYRPAIRVDGAMFPGVSASGARG